jgi:hypothetical protein
MIKNPPRQTHMSYFHHSIGHANFQARHQENREAARTLVEENPIAPEEWERLEREGLPSAGDQFSHLNDNFIQPNIRMPQHQDDSDADSDPATLDA